MFFVEGHIFKFFKILFWVNHNRANVRVTIFAFLFRKVPFLFSRFRCVFQIETRMRQKHLIFLQSLIVSESQKIKFLHFLSLSKWRN